MISFRPVACVALLLAAPCRAADPPSTTKPATEKPRLTIETPEVRKALRDTARQLASVDETREIPATKVAATFRLSAPPLRQPVAVECRLFDCIGYDASGKPVRTLPPPATPGVLSTDADTWYSCQSRSNMLSTFERFDQCAGIPTTSIFAR